jgi:hypothetical protein
MDRPAAPAPDPEPGDRPPRSSFEDYEIPEPEQVRRVGRPAVVTTAALVLLISALLHALAVFVFAQSPLFLALAAAQFLGAVLVFTLHPLGRPLGLALGAIGVAEGLAHTPSDATSGVMAIALNAFVIWALFATGGSFRRG